VISRSSVCGGKIKSVSTLEKERRKKEFGRISIVKKNEWSKWASTTPLSGWWEFCTQEKAKQKIRVEGGRKSLAKQPPVLDLTGAKKEREEGEASEEKIAGDSRH